jgi:predicted CXXCH cytochrome family protein
VNRLRPTVRALVVVLGFLLFEQEGEALEPEPFTLIHPSDQTVVGGAGQIHLVLEANERFKIAVRFNGKPVAEPKIVKQIYHYPLRLQFGLNRIEIEAADGGRITRQEKRDVYFFSQIVKGLEIPRGFKADYFHSAANNRERCAGCHQLDPQINDRSPAAPKESSCYTCHKGLVQFKQVHGPAALWNCLACHDARSSPVRYTTPIPVRNLCYGCHKEQKEYFFSSQYQHGPTATGMCTICHNPHASDFEFWLKKEPWDLCTTCHADKASGRHVLAWGPTGDTHPTRGRPDPMKPEREFSCRSCHNPHASNAPKLWNFNAVTTYQLCWTCHQK